MPPSVALNAAFAVRGRYRRYHRDTAARDAPTTASMSTSEQEPSPCAGTPAKPRRIILTPDSVHLVCPGLLEIRLTRNVRDPGAQTVGDSVGDARFGEGR